MDRGFILDATYRIEEERPVVHLFGVAEDGQSFVVRDGRVRPSFMIATADLERARPILDEVRRVGAPGFPRVGENAWRTLDGEPASEVFAAVPPDIVPLREALRAAGIDCHEADVPFVTRYLLDRGIRGALRIDGEARRGRRVARIYTDVSLEPDDFEPHLRVLSLDLETDPQANRIYAFALYALLPLGGRVAEVHAVALPEHREPPDSVEGPRGAAPCFYHRNERELLLALQRRVREIDPDVLTGWNLIGFDLTVLEKAYRRHDLPFFLGRADLPCRIRPPGEGWTSGRARVPGRAVLDGLDLVRGAFLRLEDYSLDAAARTFLGEGKTLSAENRGAEIGRLYREELPRFLHYNLTDARLVIEILQKLDLVPLAVRRTLLTGLPIDRVGASIAAFDFLYIGALHRRRIAAPSVEMLSWGQALRGEQEPPPIGGHVLDPVPGIHDQVWLFDYRSLYPSLILTFNIDPLGFLQARQAEADGSSGPPGESQAGRPSERSGPREGGERRERGEPSEHGEQTELGGGPLIRAPNGARFPQTEGILPGIVRTLAPRRQEAQRRGDRIASTAIKILMNSFYGVLATPRCRFHSMMVSNAITTFGHRVLAWTKAELEGLGHRVIYGDTDSVFAVSGIGETRAARERGAEVVAQLNQSLQTWVRDEYGLESRLELEFERLYAKFFMPSQRRGRVGSKKRHAGLIETPAGPELIVTGLESVRSDWTVLAKDFQRQLLRMVLEGEPVENYVAELVQSLRAGERDGDLVYRKRLRKALGDYGKTTPPHVKAARLMEGRHGRIISYVMTTQGPQPLGFVTAPLDYEHYVEKQLRPIGESILVHVDLSFDEALGRGGQLGLL